MRWSKSNPHKAKDFLIKKEYLLIIISSVLIFLNVAAVFGQSGLVGKYGHQFSIMNRDMFGYISYFYLVLLLYPVFVFFKRPGFSLRRLELTIGTMLLFIAVLIAQALLFEKPNSGELGMRVVGFFSPLIGIAGVWLFLLMLVLLSVTLLFDVSFDELAERFTAYLKRALGALKRALGALFAKKARAEESGHESISPKSPPPPKAKESIPEREQISAKEAAPERTRSSERLYAFEDMEGQEEMLSAQEEFKADERDVEFPSPDERIDSKVKIVNKNSAQNPQETTQKETPPPQQEPEPSPAPQQPKMPPKEEPKKSGVEILKELEENRELLSQMEKGEVEKPQNFKLPPTTFLQAAPEQSIEIDENEIDQKIEDLLDKLYRFKIEGDVVRTYAGPVVTTFEFRPAPNVKVSKILTLEDDLAMALRAKTIRIQAPVPGKDVVGIEIPNNTVETIYLRELLESEIYKEAASPLTIALGKDIVGNPFVTDLQKLPHLLIAGTTGSGKSVGINAMILSLLYKNSPDSLKLMMIDPKMLEFSIYNDIPHLLTPVITEAKKAVVALNNMVSEMERRYALMKESKVKNIEGYNRKAKGRGEKALPYIVVIIDELADLMMTSGKDVEYSIGRLAQMARASGIHLIVATQRPSVDVVTGLIKANLPSRISYKVGQKIDSKVILDTFGAESLLGKGDMLFTPPGSSVLVRLHAPWSSEEEIESIVDFLKEQREAKYDDNFIEEDSPLAKAKGAGADADLDEFYDEAKAIVLRDRKTSISYIQRSLKIGYNRAANIVEQLEQTGVLSEADSKGAREIIGA